MQLSRALAIAVLVGAIAPAAVAQEAIATGSGCAPPPAAEAAPLPAPAPAADEQSPEAIGRWARGVLAGAPSEEDRAAQPRAGCIPPPDRKPHGSVWAGVGTGGYREVGAVVTQPIGDCGSVTIAVDKIEGGDVRARRR